ncbi:TPA: sulfite exporter TauE/SafE family protein [Legionella pneumophila]|uniref:sulfite exporter TauE/SafE family protein n=1 Tax=Legionella pneumophila TaxID=446 RepID=UPI0005C43001|nr:sulfite exporter TauE/SafE family protein [Legionella pneumophila]HAT9434014.1 TSUP family transporter [Legionella pneumophila subsp. pneumophila]MCK1887578.1 sulfite exporter TauE/SafE family protein [Legionella pneumophila]MCW8406533.1 sulfite exporter TauE/SafE family protein [Legionella pneumophila]RYB35687.1 sulfite exporter TauE/SafE family protein [Legionella pneumophila]RYB42960.1 sulfite exporter TauE/SafE family protein [Legionella pneumophila]
MQAMITLYPLAGAVTGFLVGLTGIGGGALMTPLLLLFFGVSPQIAIATDLWFAAVTKTFASYAHHQEKQVDWQIVKYLWVGSLPAALIFSQLATSHFVTVRQSQILIPAVAAMILITAVNLLYSSIKKSSSKTIEVVISHFPRKRCIATGFFLGAIVATTSIGAGALGTVFLLNLFASRLTTSKLIGTDIMHAIPLSLTAGISYLIGGSVDFHLLLLLLLGSIPGALLGSRASKILSVRYLKLSLSGLLLFSGLKLIV